jgi:hypothetical protein
MQRIVEEYDTEQLKNGTVFHGLLVGCWLQKGEELKIADYKELSKFTDLQAM